jgi:hypothetical protein
MEQRRQAAATQLANQGVAPGSEAYNREMAMLNQAENDAYTQLMLQGSWSGAAGDLCAEKSADQRNYRPSQRNAGAEPELPDGAAQPDADHGQCWAYQ